MLAAMSELTGRWVHLLAVPLIACSASLPEDEAVVPAPTDAGIALGAPVTATLGAAGGTLATTDARFAVVVPPGALAADTEIAIQPITNTAHGGRGQGYSLSPDGLTFAQPVELRFKPSEADLDGSALEFASVARQDAEGYWEELDTTRDAATGTVTVTTTHFSHYSPTLSLYLVPAATSVEVEAFKAFEVWICSSEYRDPSSGRRAAFCKRWQSASAARSLGDWSVNGVVGGNATVGTATYTGPGAMSYEAPAKVPADNPVKVSVSVRNYRDKPVAPLVGRVRVTGKGLPYDGTVTWENGYYGAGDGSRSTARVHLAVARTLTHSVDYSVTGSVDVDFRSPDCAPVTLTLPVLTSEAFSKLVVYGPEAIRPSTFSLSLETEQVDRMLQCSGSSGPFTRRVTIGTMLACSGMAYSDASELSSTDGSKCSGISNVSVTLTRQ